MDFGTVWVSRPKKVIVVLQEVANSPVRFDVAGAGDGVTESLNGTEAGNGGHSQGASCTPPRRCPPMAPEMPLRWAMHMIKNGSCVPAQGDAIRQTVSAQSSQANLRQTWGQLCELQSMASWPRCVEVH